jgi:hypothetical protein
VTRSIATANGYMYVSVIVVTVTRSIATANGCMCVHRDCCYGDQEYCDCDSDCCYDDQDCCDCGCDCDCGYDCCYAAPVA